MTLLSDGSVLLVGGGEGDGASGLASAERFDPGSGRWDPTGAMDVARWLHAAVLLADGTVLVVGGTIGAGGDVLASAERYDPTSGTWTPTGDLSAGCFGQTATVLDDGRVLVAGGFRDLYQLTSEACLEVYDPTSGTWAGAGGGLASRTGHTATLLADGRVLILGGFRTAALPSADLYDPRIGR
jgi:hypothetical protein